MFAKRFRPVWLALSLLAGLVAVSACSAAMATPGSKTTTTGTTTSSPTAGATTTGTGTASPGATGTAAGTGPVMVKNGPMGAYLTDSQGRSLYLFEADQHGTPTCTGQCLTFWPPALVTGTAQPGPGVNAGMLGTTNSPNGGKMLTYNGHPLYYFVGDKTPGQTTGQGLNNFGALWWLVAPSGNAITAKGGTTSGPSGSSPGQAPAPGAPGY